MPVRVQREDREDDDREFAGDPTPAEPVPAGARPDGREDVSEQADAAGPPRAPSLTKGGLTLLVIEDDPGGVPSVPEMLNAAGGYLPDASGTGGAKDRIRVRTARDLHEAERLLSEDVQCILLDLALTGQREPPGATAATGPVQAPGELDILRQVLRLAPRQAVLALTDGADAVRAAAAVSAGAQDYLFRDELDGRVLSRAIRYAVERKRADRAQWQLSESRLRAQENARLERGLLPTPLLEGSDLRFVARYRPGRSRALLGGDFYDTVRTPDGTVHAMIGDVAGHGPDEAALGVELRIAWRALTFAGLCGDQLLGTLQKVLEHERAGDEVYATLCTVDISPDGRRAGLCLAGHPAPLLLAGGGAPRLLPYDGGGPVLGVLPKARWPRRQVQLGGAWSLLMYTDGLIEGHVGEGRRRLGQDGMVDIVAQRRAEGVRGQQLLDATMEEVRRLNGGELTDDVAALLLERG